MLEVLGEHVMGSAGPLQLVPGFFGADEALTDYEPGRPEWAATLIVAADGAREARDRAATVVAELARCEGLRRAPEDELA
jgi:pyrrolysine biosynthesis protein PylC